MNSEGAINQPDLENPHLIATVVDNQPALENPNQEHPNENEYLPDSQPMSCGPLQSCFCVVYLIGWFLWYTIPSIIPGLGQYLGWKVYKEYDEYVADDEKFTADYILVCSTYGVYGMYLLIKSAINKCGKCMDCISNMFTCIRDTYANALNSSWKMWCQSLHNDLNFGDKFCGYVGMTILTLGTATFFMVWSDVSGYGRKFVEQHDDIVKYCLGHVFRLLTWGPLHVIGFSLKNWNATYMSDRVLSRCMFGITAVLYAVYCYYWYAVKWVYYNEPDLSNTQQNTQQNAQQNTQQYLVVPNPQEIQVRLVEENDYGNTPVAHVEVVNSNANQVVLPSAPPAMSMATERIKINHSLINSKEEQKSSEPIDNVIQLELQTQQTVAEKQTQSTRDFLWFMGTIMLTIGTGGLYLVPFKIIEVIVRNIELTPEEWTYMQDTCGFYIFYKLWKVPYVYLMENRTKCTNCVSKLFLELGLFALTLSISWWTELDNLYCVPFTKRYYWGLAQIFPLAPFLMIYAENTLVRLSGKAILIAYNIIVAYFVTVASGNSPIAIALFVAISYPTFSIYKFFATNRTILKTLVEWKKFMIRTYRSFKYYVYCCKYYARHSFVSAYNNMMIFNSRIKNWYRTGKAYRKNILFRQMQGKPIRTQGDPKFKRYRVSKPEKHFMTQKKFKTWEDYDKLFNDRREQRLKYKNTTYILKCAAAKILSAYYAKIHCVVIHDTCLWASRYDDFIKKFDTNPHVYLGDLYAFQQNMFTFVNNQISEINSLQLEFENRNQEFNAYTKCRNDVFKIIKDISEVLKIVNRCSKDKEDKVLENSFTTALCLIIGTLSNAVHVENVFNEV